jgi:CRP/FNR family cyclic AMP-dependent transcriptional regulator
VIAENTLCTAFGAWRMHADIGLTEAVIAETFGCSAQLAIVLAEKARPRAFSPKAAIIQRDTRNRHIHLVLNGHAQSLALSIDGRQVLIEDFYAGALFGEDGALGDGLAAEEVVAVTQLLAGIFANADFLGMMENYACVALTISRLLARRLSDANRKMVEVATISAPGRVYAELLRQARLTGDWTLNPAPVVAELAMLVQTTRETASRAISAIEKRGIVTRDQGVLTIVAPHRLEDLIY